MASGLAVPSSRRYDLAGAERSEGGQPWTATTRTLNTLREWGLDASALRERRTAHIAAVSPNELEAALQDFAAVDNTSGVLCLATGVID